MEKKVLDVVTKDCATVKLYEGVDKLIENLLKPGRACAIVVDEEDKPYQIITVKDLLKVFLWQVPVTIVFDVLKHLNKRKESLVFVEKGESLTRAFELMKEHNWDYLPVTDEKGRFIGILQGKRVVERFPEIVYTDPLTGLPNRGYLRIVEEKVKKRNGQIGVLMIDVDDFKKVNDTRGHLVGDDVLKKVAHVLRKNVRPYDEVLRYGGEEFVAFIYRCNNGNLYKVAERLRLSVESMEDFDFKVTVSIGGYCMESGSDDDLTSAIEKADKALYEAKRTGKNKVVLYEN